MLQFYPGLPIVQTVRELSVCEVKPNRTDNPGFYTELNRYWSL
jgi:hypothetical protein